MTINKKQITLVTIQNNLLCRLEAMIIIFLAMILTGCSESSVNNTIADPVADSVKNSNITKDSSEIGADTKWKNFVAPYSFDSFPASIYNGKLAAPDFSSVTYGRDKRFRKFINERIPNTPVNFAGRYSIIGKSCGAMCSSIFMVDRKTGKIFSFPGTDGHWGYEYYPNSTLLLANSSLLDDSMHKATKYSAFWNIDPEFYYWTGAAFKRLP